VPKITFFTQAAKDSSNEAASSEALVNLYPEQGAGDGRTAIALRSVPGEASFANTTAPLVRASAAVGGEIYIAANAGLYSVQSDGTSSLHAPIADSSITTISENGSNVTIAADGNYYVWDGSSISQPSGGILTNIGAVAYMEQYTILIERNGNRFEWTDPADPKTRNALYFTSADGRNDNCLRGIADKRYLYIFKERSIEIWYNTGASGASAFVRLGGGVIDQGLKSYSLVTRFDQGVFFIGDDGVAYIMSGGQLQSVSTPPVNVDIDASTPVQVMYYEDRGHKFCVVRFSDRPAWVYDLTTLLWHRRASLDPASAWDTVNIVSAWGNYYAMKNDGNVHLISRTDTDVAGELPRRMISKPLYMAGRKFTVSEMELLARVGASDLGRDAVAILRTSWDGGLTWSREDTRSLGDLGDYSTRAIWRRLGRGVQFAAEITVTDPADITLYSDANVVLA
jgi:hypothetical protein